MMLLMMSTGLDQVTAFSAVAATLNNLGPGLGEVAQHIADLATGAFFFAMRGCEFSKTYPSGKTTPIELRDLLFRDKRRRKVSTNSADWRSRAEFVTVMFRDQKNGKKR